LEPADLGPVSKWESVGDGKARGKVLGKVATAPLIGTEISSSIKGSIVLLTFGSTGLVGLATGGQASAAGAT